MVKTSWNSKNR